MAGRRAKVIAVTSGKGGVGKSTLTVSLGIAAASSGKRVLLIDDLITTGATLSEAAQTLRFAGASGVSCATLAATRQKNSR